MKGWIHICACTVLLTLTRGDAEDLPETDRPSLIIAVGTGGDKEYDETFANWAANWLKAAERGGARVKSIPSPQKRDGAAEEIQAALRAEASMGASPLWLVLIGHGSVDGVEGKFNLEGDDVSASDLAAWLKPLERPVIVVNTFSASGAFLKPLSAPDRVIVTATKSGRENNFSRLGRYLSESISDDSADLDHDGQTSLLEAWLRAAQRVREFYESEGRLATEHSLLDDNGDGLGTPAEWFQGLRVAKKSKDAAAPDGTRAHQMHLIPNADDRALPPDARAARDAIESELAELRRHKETIDTKEYESRLEAILLRLARIYRQLSSSDKNRGTDKAVTEGGEEDATVAP